MAPPATAPGAERLGEALIGSIGAPGIHSPIIGPRGHSLEPRYDGFALMMLAAFSRK